MKSEHHTSTPFILWYRAWLASILHTAVTRSRLLTFVVLQRRSSFGKQRKTVNLYVQYCVKTYLFIAIKLCF